MLNVAIIGAGAAGCFCAVNLKRMLGNNCSIDVFEAGRKPLAKVAITGGGRCNLTNSFQQVSSLALAYPRGERLMKRLFFSFSNDDAMRWWQNNGVELVVQNDCCVFPRSQDAMQIVSTLTSAMTQSGVRTHLQHRVSSLQRLIDGKYRLSFSNDANSAVADVVLVAVGGCPSANMLSFLEPLALNIKPVVPSLFTFNIKDSALTQLMGVVVKDACVSIPSTKFKADGPLLVTHWGLSGPAILKLSSYSAVFLAEKDYKAPLLVSWLGRKTQPEVEALLSDFVNDSANKMVQNEYPQQLTQRLWSYLLSRAGVPAELRWRDVGRKLLNKLCSVLICDEYRIDGRGQYKEEFVTCGGVALDNLDQNSLQCKSHPGLYFAGEVTDVDAITGGFNLQAAWTMGYVVAKSIAQNFNKQV